MALLHSTSSLTIITLQLASSITGWADHRCNSVTAHITLVVYTVARSYTSTLISYNSTVFALHHSYGITGHLLNTRKMMSYIPRVALYSPHQLQVPAEYTVDQSYFRTNEPMWTYICEPLTRFTKWLNCSERTCNWYMINSHHYNSYKVYRYNILHYNILPYNMFSHYLFLK